MASTGKPQDGVTPAHEQRLIEAAEREVSGWDSEESGLYAAVAASLPQSFAGYDIVREIHRGGQGVIYQAIQKGTRRKVAIKVMKEGPYAGQQDKARFDREVQILGALNHPNIVTIHDSGAASGNHYFVMDYISGQPLDVWMASGQRSIGEVLKLFGRICEAVNAAHLKGVIHRDLKPGNIRIDNAGEPYVLDFGLAKVATGSDALAITMTGQFMGSLPWASPEQAGGTPDKIDTRTDVYSLGVILYQMLTGKFPYEVVGNMRDVLDRIIHAEPARPSTVRRQINHEIETIVLKCLGKERDRRYQTAGELARDIGHYLKGEPIEAKRDSSLYVLRKSLRKHRLVAGFVVSLVLVIATAAVVLGILYRHADLAEADARRAVVLTEAANSRLKLLARTFAWRELVQDSPFSEECARIWPGMCSYLRAQLADHPSQFEQLPELRYLLAGLPAPDPDSTLRCLALYALQRREADSTFSWLTWESGALHPGDRLQCIIASLQPMHFQIFCVDQESRVQRLYPSPGSTADATILLYAPDVPPSTRWLFQGPSGRNTFFLIGSIASLSESVNLEEHLAPVGHWTSLADGAFYNAADTLPSDRPHDEYWKTTVSAVGRTCDWLGILSVPVVAGNN